MIMKNNGYKVTLEDCGRFFNDYIMSNNKKVYVQAYAKDLPRKILKYAKYSPEHAKAILEVVSETEPQLKEIVKEIENSGNIKGKEYDFLVSLL